MQPQNHRYYWVEAMVAEQQAQLADARVLRDKAIGLAPHNRELRQDCARFELAHSSHPKDAPEDGSPGDAAVSRAMTHLRMLTSASPNFEAGALTLLNAYACTPSQIVQLWPGDSTDELVRKARYYFQIGDISKAFIQASKVNPADAEKNEWFNAVRACLEARWNDPKAAAAFAKRALTGGPESRAVDAWLSENFVLANGDALQSLTLELQPLLGAYPKLLQTLAAGLIKERRWRAAESLLRPVAMDRSELSALYAELAYDMGDYSVALDRARAARALAPQDARWNNWYDVFQSRVTDTVAKAKVESLK
jgi:predicted Zn-dependent protease